jgi:predicted CopG family antitoxin
VKTIQIDSDIYEYLVSKAVGIGEPPSRILRRELGLPNLPNKKEIDIDDDVYGYLVSKSVDLGESASDILRRELHLDNEPNHEHGGGPRMVEFHIPAGTGTNPWNTRDQTVNASVGDTLRIVNDDSIPHRLHTNGLYSRTRPGTLRRVNHRISSCRRLLIRELNSLRTTTTADQQPRSGSLFTERTRQPYGA